MNTPLTKEQAESIAAGLNATGGHFAVVDADTIMRLNDQKDALRATLQRYETALKRLEVAAKDAHGRLTILDAFHHEPHTDEIIDNLADALNIARQALEQKG